MTKEASNRQVQDWLGRQPAEELAISWWVTTEFSSALSIKLRNGQIEVAALAAALVAFSHMSAATVWVLPLTGRHFRMAAQFADQHTTGLRSSDALRLAVCSDYGAEL
jgi:predicted nucleic acid-binding protein